MVNSQCPSTGWPKTTKGWSYGRKCQSSLDVGTRMIMDWLVTRGSIHDSEVAREMIDSAMDFTYLLADSAYDKPEI